MAVHHQPGDDVTRDPNHLPVVEADRDLDDWGRSERLSRTLDRTLWDVAYKYWYRARLQQPRRVPAAGGALLVVNGGGAASPVTALLAKALREAHPQRRDARPCADPELLDHPGVAVALKRAGVVAAHADDVLRLLADEDELVAIGVRTDRLHDEAVEADLAQHPALRAAVGASVPVVPVVARGMDDETTVLARVPLPGGRELPLGIGVPAVGSVSAAPLLPGAVDLRVLPPIDPDARGDVAGETARVALSVARRLRHELDDMRRERRSRWLR